MIKSRRLRWAGHVARMEEDMSSFKFLTGRPAGKRALGRPRRRWEDKICKTKQNVVEKVINEQVLELIGERRTFLSSILRRKAN